MTLKKKQIGEKCKLGIEINEIEYQYKINNTKTRSLWKNNKNTYKSFQTCKIKGKIQIAIIRNDIEDITTDFSENNLKIFVKYFMPIDLLTLMN